MLMIRTVQKDQLLLYVESLALAGLIGPCAIQLHEVAGHWLPAKLLGAKNLTIGYTMVDWGSAENWVSSKQLLVLAGGPLITNVSVFLGLKLMQPQNRFLKLLGAGIIMTAYRSLVVLFRQLRLEKPLRNLKSGSSSSLSIKSGLCDESLIAKGLGLPTKYIISVPQTGFSLWVLMSAYRLLPGKNKAQRVVLGATTFSGTAFGTLLYLKFVGPFLWPGQKSVPELLPLGLRQENS